MINEFEIEVKGREYTYDAEYSEVRDAIADITGLSEDIIQEQIDNGTWDTDAEDIDDAYDELVEDLYDELCDYFQRLKASDIAASIDMDEYVDWYYKYGRNY